MDAVRATFPVCGRQTKHLQHTIVPEPAHGTMVAAEWRALPAIQSDTKGHMDNMHWQRRSNTSIELVQVQH